MGTKPKSQQIDAALALYTKALKWNGSDEILYALKDADPSMHSVYVTNFKMQTLERFYSAGLRWLSKEQKIKYVEYVVDMVMPQSKALTGFSLIEMLARFPNNTINFVFASKFAHFFISEDFPILDQYAEYMVEFFLDLPHWENIKVKKHPETKRYEVFHTNFHQLKQKNLAAYTNKQLDCYLWLVGLYKEWLQKGSVNSKEIGLLFSSLTLEGIPQPPLGDLLP